MKLAPALTTLALSAGPALAETSSNILLIIADDMGLDATRCYDVGNQQAKMPTLEALCKAGVVFENAYTPPICSPTRAAIMSGKYGFRTGVGSAIPRDGGQGLSTEITSLFDVMATTEYSTNLIGKWHLASADDGFDHPAELGVPDFFGLFRGGTRDYMEWRGVEDGRETRITGYTTTVFTDRAIDWIADQDGPWFLWLAHNAPHAPFHAPPGELHNRNGVNEGDRPDRRNALPYYQAMLEALDTEIGRLLDTMEPETRENTIVIFMGDNGSPNQVTRGFYGDHAAKGAIYDSGTNVPFVVAGPGIKPGRTDALVNSTDLYATIPALAGATATGEDAIDFSPVLSGEPGARDFVYVEHFSDQPPKRGNTYGWAMRIGDMKLVNRDGHDAELYDLARDPREAKDLLADGTNAKEAEIVDQFEAHFAALRSN